jgi:hypothetical protein
MKKLTCQLIDKTFYIEVFFKQTRSYLYAIDYLQVRVYDVKSSNFNVLKIDEIPFIKQERLLGFILSNFI